MKNTVFLHKFWRPFLDCTPQLFFRPQYVWFPVHLKGLLIPLWYETLVVNWQNWLFTLFHQSRSVLSPNPISRAQRDPTLEDKPFPFFLETLHDAPHDIMTWYHMGSIVVFPKQIHVVTGSLYGTKWCLVYIVHVKKKCLANNRISCDLRCHCTTVTSLWRRDIRSHNVTIELDCESRTSHYNDVIMGAIASQITSLTIIYSTV